MVVQHNNCIDETFETIIYLEYFKLLYYTIHDDILILHFTFTD